ncbi:Ras-related protein Rab-23 [Liparis tanakae]|uniref:small monomeric GTPase n=1 Tax=Liparis tanakae TaxID=230148 RepID=A0A4Z2HMZ1_9TELE|nr:Ras-related protein Rab-23 [Liparis tanakae]
MAVAWLIARLTAPSNSHPLTMVVALARWSSRKKVEQLQRLLQGEADAFEEEAVLHAAAVPEVVVLPEALHEHTAQSEPYSGDSGCMSMPPKQDANFKSAERRNLPLKSQGKSPTPGGEGGKQHLSKQEYDDMRAWERQKNNKTLSRTARRGSGEGKPGYQTSKDNCNPGSQHGKEVGAQACVLVFSTTDRESFQAIDSWREKVEAEVGDIPTVLVQNKIDLLEETVIKNEEAEGLAKRLKLRFYRASVKEDLNVTEVFKYLAEKYLQRLKQQTAEETEVLHTTSNKIVSSLRLIFFWSSRAQLITKA